MGSPARRTRGCKRHVNPPGRPADREIATRHEACDEVRRRVEYSGRSRAVGVSETAEPQTRHAMLDAHKRKRAAMHRTENGSPACPGNRSLRARRNRCDVEVASHRSALEHALRAACRRAAAEYDDRDAMAVAAHREGREAPGLRSDRECSGHAGRPHHH